MYKHILLDEIDVQDFSLADDVSTPNRLINAVFPDVESYIKGDISGVKIGSEEVEPHEMLTRAYLDLITSRGRNEPDDRLCTIEVVHGNPLPLDGNLKAVVVPHTFLRGRALAPWLSRLKKRNVEIAPYEFVPGKHPEHYHALLELSVRRLYQKWGIID